MSAPAPQTIAFAIWGPIARDDLPGLTERVCALLRGSGAALALCDVNGVDPDAVTVDALARLQLAASRLGCRVVLRNASPALSELVDLMGLQDVIPDHDGRLEAARRRDSAPSGSRSRRRARPRRRPPRSRRGREEPSFRRTREPAGVNAPTASIAPPLLCRSTQTS